MFPAAGEGVDGKKAVVLAPSAVARLGGVLKIQQLLPGEETAGLAGVMGPGDQCGAEGPHDSGYIWTDDPDPGDRFKRAEHGLVTEGAALNDDVRAELRWIGEFDHLVQGVLDDRIRQPRRDVPDGGAFLLRLFHVGVHEDGAAGAEVHGVFGKEGFLCEAFRRIAEGIGKVFQKGSAAGTAGLVEQYVVDGTMAEPDALHILAADVQHTVHLRVEECGGGAVCDGLDLAFIKVKGGFEKLLPVTGGAGAHDMRVLRKL